MKPLSVMLAALPLTTALALPARAQPDLVLLVRHAERASEPAADPGLTPAGEQRAQALAQALAGARVGTILTTQFRRTRETAAPLAHAAGVPPQVVDAGGDLAAHTQALLDAVRAAKGTVLVVGHGNTVPALIAALGGPQLPDLCETSFQHVFVLHPASGALAQLRYGEAGEPPTAGCL